MHAVNAPERIGRQAFLLNGREFALVREQGHKTVGRMIVLGYAAAPDGQVRLGLICSRRYDRRAVERNRARRLLRESYRQLRPHIDQPLWLVAIARDAMHGRKQPEVQAELACLLARIPSLPPEPEAQP